MEESDGWFVMIETTPMLAVQHVEDPTDGKNRIHLDLNTDDVDATLDELLKAGATLIGDRGDENFRWVTLADPQGNRFCIAKH